MAGRAGRRGAGRALRRLAVHGGRRQRRCLGAPAPVPLRRHGRRAAGRVQRHRAGLGYAGLPLGRDGPRRLPLAAPAREAQRRFFHGYRIDHLVGFYRTFSRPLDSRQGSFDPSEGARRSSRWANVSWRSSPGAGREIIAEDLGIVPDFVRRSLARLGIPGYKVFRWERAWNDAGQPFRDPSAIPGAFSGHDRHARHRPNRRRGGTRQPRTSAAHSPRLPQIAPVLNGRPEAAPFTPALRDVILARSLARRPTCC